MCLLPVRWWNHFIGYVIGNRYDIYFVGCALGFYTISSRCTVELPASLLQCNRKYMTRIFYPNCKPDSCQEPSLWTEWPTVWARKRARSFRLKGTVRGKGCVGAGNRSLEASKWSLRGPLWEKLLWGRREQVWSALFSQCGQQSCII